MSRKKDNYDSSHWLKFKKWINGDVDLLAQGMEAWMSGQETTGADHSNSSRPGNQRLEIYEAIREEELKNLPIFAKGFDKSVAHGLDFFERLTGSCPCSCVQEL